MPKKKEVQSNTMKLEKKYYNTIKINEKYKMKRNTINMWRNARKNNEPASGPKNVSSIFYSLIQLGCI